MSSNQQFPFLGIGIGLILCSRMGGVCACVCTRFTLSISFFMRSWQKALTLLSLLPLATQVVRGDATHMVSNTQSNTLYKRSSCWDNSQAMTTLQRNVQVFGAKAAFQVARMHSLKVT